MESIVSMYCVKDNNTQDYKYEYERKNVKGTYSKIANEFHKTRRNTWEWIERFISFVPDGGQILDVGCGPGWLLSSLSNEWNKYALSTYKHWYGSEETTSEDIRTIDHSSIPSQYIIVSKPYGVDTVTDPTLPVAERPAGCGLSIKTIFRTPSC